MSEPVHQVKITNQVDDSYGCFIVIFLWMIWWQLDNIADALAKIAAHVVAK